MEKVQFQEGYFDRLECECQGEFYTAGSILGNRYLCTNLSVMPLNRLIYKEEIINPTSKKTY